jgi:hypothetical protein
MALAEASPVPEPDIILHEEGDRPTRDPILPDREWSWALEYTIRREGTIWRATCRSGDGYQITHPSKSRCMDLIETHYYRHGKIELAPFRMPAPGEEPPF